MIVNQLEETLQVDWSCTAEQYKWNGWSALEVSPFHRIALLHVLSRFFFFHAARTVLRACSIDCDGIIFAAAIWWHMTAFVAAAWRLAGEAKLQRSKQEEFLSGRESCEVLIGIGATKTVCRAYAVSLHSRCSIHASALKKGNLVAFDCIW